MEHEYCECCGNILKENEHTRVCNTCRLTAPCIFMDFNCPECGAPLEIYHKCILDHIEPIHPDEWPYLKVGLLYHCKHCGCDWSSEYVYEFGDTGQSKLKRHYWG